MNVIAWMSKTILKVRIKRRKKTHAWLHSVVSGVAIYFLVAVYLCASVVGVIAISKTLFEPYTHPFLVALIEVVVLFIVSVLVSVIGGVIFRTRKLEMLNKLVTFPGKWNYNWQGGYSLLVFVILHTVTFFRAVSCLQLGKYIYRKYHSNNKDMGASRANVPPIFQELYFVLWIVFLAVQVSAGMFNELIFGLDIYFIVESLTWIFYYSIFRRFFEENYSIYHVLEHLPLVLLLIPAQAVAYAKTVSYSTPNITWRDVLVVLLGQAEENQIFFSCVGFLYSAIVISMILSMFPIENIKRGNLETIIVGAGDVVKHRLLPAILRRELLMPTNKRRPVAIYDIHDGECISSWMADDVKSMWSQLRFDSAQKTRPIFDLVNLKNSGGEQIAWICTPSDTHWYYLLLLLEKSDYVVVEKPLTSRQDELELFKEYVHGENRDRTFFLSYYLLEKALPMTFLCRPKQLYLKYLAGYTNDGLQIMDEKASMEMIETCYQAYLEGGTIKSFTMRVVEGEDSRNLPEGGQFIETFVHHCIMASLFSGLPSSWTEVRFAHLENDFIEMTARGRNRMFIQLSLRKGPKVKEEQSAVVVMEKSGNQTVLTANLKQKILTIQNNKLTRAFGVKDIYRGKYDVQCAMVYDCFENSIPTSELDGLYNQIEVLDWLMRIDPAIVKLSARTKK